MIKDHPRIRGKHEKAKEAVRLWRGSPPHTRETPKYQAAALNDEGITPAYAGNTGLKQHFKRV